MNVTKVIDCKSSNLSVVDQPPGAIMAGYGTGTPDVQWTTAQIAAHPGMVLFDQSPVNTSTDETCDVFDVENMAGTLGDIVGWVIGARANYAAGQRPGQRRPALYMSSSTVTPAANVMVAAGLATPVPIWLAAPMPEQTAITLVQEASGPFPIIGVQYEFHPTYDVSVVSSAWLNDVNGRPVIPAPEPGTQAGWRYCNKCSTLFYGPGQAVSHCPAGGQHDGTHSHDYRIGYDQ